MVLMRLGAGDGLSAEQPDQVVLAPLRKKPPPSVDYNTATFVPFTYWVVWLKLPIWLESSARLQSSDRLLSAPVHWLNGPQHKQIDSGTQNCNAGRDSKGPVKMAGSFNHNSSDKRCEHPSKIGDTVLEAAPFSRSFGSSNSLGRCPVA